MWFVKSAVRKQHNHSLTKIPTLALFLYSPRTCQATETLLFWIQLNGSKVGLSTAPFSELLYLQTVAQAMQLGRFHRFSLRPSKINGLGVRMWHQSLGYFRPFSLCTLKYEFRKMIKQTVFKYNIQ